MTVDFMVLMSSNPDQLMHKYKSVMAHWRARKKVANLHSNLCQCIPSSLATYPV